MIIMAIGRLRHYLKYQTYSATQNDYNEDVEGYTDNAQIWGSIKPISGKEFEIAQTINSNISCKIRVRNMIGITDSIKPSDRFQDAQTNDIYNIHSAVKFMQTTDTWVDCLCSIDQNPET